jgi:phosphohistidine phosphatase
MEKGVKRVRQAGAGLTAIGFKPTHLLTSPLVRSHETAKILHEAMGLKLSLKVCDELLPDTPPDKIFPLLDVLPPNARVVCVGHEPYLSEAAGLLLFGKAAAGLTMKKAGACLIHIPEVPGPARGFLHWWLTPLQLRMIGKCRKKRRQSP